MRQAATKTGPSTWVASVYDGVEQCARFGVTSLGDIKSRFIRDGRMMMALLSNAVRFTSYGEVTAMAQRRELLDERLGDAVEEPEDTPGVRVGVSPHAPYSIEDGGYRRCLAIARERGLPLTTHLAETPDEAEFLATHTGPFRDLWARLGAWDDRVPAFDGGPIRYAQALGLLDYERTLLAHVNYCDDDELAILARGKASVVYCPRTHRYFGHPPHRWREMLATGINVAVGTDSCASSPDLNLVDDLRLLHEIAPEVEPRLLWEVATVRGARAIDAPRVGSLTPGQYADVVAFAVSSADPLREILESRIEPVRVWCGGRVVKSARG
jgi:cytosine/adenosine deaminase-related metal-dependent hydrolase